MFLLNPPIDFKEMSVDALVGGANIAGINFLTNKIEEFVKEKMESSTMEKKDLVAHLAGTGGGAIVTLIEAWLLEKYDQPELAKVAAVSGLATVAIRLASAFMKKEDVAKFQVNGLGDYITPERMLSVQRRQRALTTRANMANTKPALQTAKRRPILGM